MAKFATPPQKSEAHPALSGSHGSGSHGTIDWSAEFVKHEGWLRKVLRCRVNPSVVEDCLQDIAVAIFRQTNKPVDPDKVPAWLYRLAIRHSINTHRKNGRRKNLIDRFKQTREEQSELSTDPLDWLVQNEQRSQVRQAMDQLRAQDREVLLLKYTENWSYKKMAKQLGTTTTTIEYRLVKAKKNLRRLLISMNINDNSRAGVIS